MAAKQIYKSARGKQVDMLKLAKRNEMAVAVGNAKVNARGDKLGPGGTIIKHREAVVAEKLGIEIPNQVNVREAPVVEETPVATKPSKKDISTQDPEGNE
jgi:hypothetical protein